jgi:hypothetical protein
MANREGYGKGRIDPSYQDVENGVPLLSTFYFRFEKEGTSDAVDNEINTIMVLPAGDAEDLTPNAEGSVVSADDRTITLIYKDKDADDKKDRYFYKVAHAVEPSVKLRRYQIRGVGCEGKCEIGLPHPQDLGPAASLQDVFILVGFQLSFTGSRDHHIDTIGITEENGKLTIELNDKNDDDVFRYVIDYAVVTQGAGLSIKTGKESGSATAATRRRMPQGRIVLRGFRFDSKFKDHHLRELGVLTSNENLEVYFGDKTGDDPFDWQVDWAIVTPQELGPAADP